jgi:hypothetical protein
MITEKDIEFIQGTPTAESIALVWVIDGDCLYDLPLSRENAKMFLDHNQVLDISDDYPNHDGVTVRFMKNNEILNDFQTSEYFGSVLLSNPQVLDLAAYPYGDYVSSPYAQFDGEKFILLGRDMSDLDPWFHPREN